MTHFLFKKKIKQLTFLHLKINLVKHLCLSLQNYLNILKQILLYIGYIFTTKRLRELRKNYAFSRVWCIFHILAVTKEHL